MKLYWRPHSLFVVSVLFCYCIPFLLFIASVWQFSKDYQCSWGLDIEATIPLIAYLWTLFTLEMSLVTQLHSVGHCLARKSIRIWNFLSFYCTRVWNLSLKNLRNFRYSFSGHLLRRSIQRWYHQWLLIRTYLLLHLAALWSGLGQTPSGEGLMTTESILTFTRK